MTPDIMAMPAGREMDALVWMAINGQKPNILICRYVDGDYQPHAGYPVGHISPPHYSTDIAVAWEAMEKFKERSWSIYWERGHWVVEEMHVTAETAPLAICRAALLAMEPQ